MALTRSFKRRRNYALVKNTFGDDKLARQARDWGDARLFRELGISIKKPNKIPPLRKFTAKNKSYYERKLEAFLEARKRGLEVKEAKRYTRYNKSRKESTFDYRKELKAKYNVLSRAKRLDLWENWAENKSFPPEIVREAQRINKNFNKENLKKSENARIKYVLDDNDHYGFAVQFYMFVEDLDIDDVRKLVEPDAFDRYRLEYASTVRAI